SRGRRGFMSRWCHVGACPHTPVKTTPPAAVAPSASPADSGRPRLEGSPPPERTSRSPRPRKGIFAPPGTGPLVEGAGRDDAASLAKGLHPHGTGELVLAGIVDRAELRTKPM